MGYLLKEVLKTLCGVNQWSYAVLWTIGCQNPKLLIWEECYYETIPCSALPRIPGIESSEMAFEEWEARRFAAESRISQIGVQAENNVGSLINKMMMGNRVNIVGEGLVGWAACTGDHLWVLSQYYATETHPPEVQNELCQQFSSGMKTVAVILVLNHGVVQLASYLTIMENMAFVNDVKSLIVQLGCVPGAPLSDNYTSTEPAPKIGVPVCLGKSVSADSGWCYMAKNSNSFVADSCNQQSISSQAFELVGQPSHSLSIQIEDNLQGTSSKFRTPKLAQNDLFQSSTTSVIKPSIPFNSQHENGETAAGIIPSNLELWLNQQAPLFNSRCGFNGEQCVGSSLANSSNLRLMEEPILSNVVREHFNNSLRTSGAFITSQARPNGGLNSNGQLHNGASSHPSSILNSCSLPTTHRSANHDFSCTYLTGGGPNASKIEVSTSDLTHHLTSCHVLSESSTDHPSAVKCYQIEVAKRKERIETDLFQANNISLAHLGEHATLSETISGFRHDDQKHDYGNQSPRSQNVKYKDEYVQSSSGDDLFDILGVDFKNKIFSESCSNSLNDGPDINADTWGKKNYTSLNLQNADSDLYSINKGNSDSGIFTATGTYDLLDAVVNRVHTASKHSLDDTMSCRTTLTKISSSSIANASPSYGRGSGSDKMQDDLFEHPKSLAKLGALGPCSFKSECSKEDAGNYSQTSSIYGSQISSWVEQGHSNKHNNSASTAYSKRPDAVSKSSRKRPKPGENPRPRPKDRQLIQDRMKELKEIVPNGAKCSIDALLERTIKHMLFLQSVTKQADRLKQTGESKIISKDGGLLLKEGFEGGRTWAYEVGSQSMVCPIIVEDLNAPRQMLVEMLCEERGLLLEIADKIKGLELTILQGVMETQNDKIWARFVVEANRDVTRMEIFISLVHLLDQTVKISAASGNDIVSIS
ncbi:transcription factor LHW-like [Actinidia eriantha]|uniref:transcription factor LHW-like n=1 Tax=Actinidia eriantha TaxID=165200 RepID=UPI00258A3EC5|nr:transcription factor LHW-like [Actinidia eriantha]